MPNGIEKREGFEIVDFIGEDYLSVGNFYIKPSITSNGKLSLVVYESGSEPGQTDAANLQLLISDDHQMRLESW